MGDKNVCTKCDGSSSSQHWDRPTPARMLPWLENTVKCAFCWKHLDNRPTSTQTLNQNCSCSTETSGNMSTFFCLFHFALASPCQYVYTCTDISITAPGCACFVFFFIQDKLFVCVITSGSQIPWWTESGIWKNTVRKFSFHQCFLGHFFFFLLLEIRVIWIIVNIIWCSLIYNKKKHLNNWSGKQ